MQGDFKSGLYFINIFGMIVVQSYSDLEENMSGHSKWSTIKHKKAKVDSQRAVVFQKYSRELIVLA